MVLLIWVNPGEATRHCALAQITVRAAAAPGLPWRACFEYLR